MKKSLMYLAALSTVAIIVFSVNGCKKDDGPSDLQIATLMAGTVNLNEATAPTNVPSATTITATFNTNIDAATATNTNITLVRDYDKASIALTFAVTTNTIVITPKEDLGNGALYKLSFTTGLKSTDGLAMTAVLERAFTTVGTFVPAGMIAYFDFNDNVNDQVGDYSPTAAGIIDLTYVASRNTLAGNAGLFNGTSTLVEIPNGDVINNTNNFTISFWVKADSTKHGQFVLGLAGWFGFQFEITGDYKWCKLAAQYNLGDGSSNSEDLYFSGDGQTGSNGGWQGWTFCKDLTTSGGVPGLLADKWAAVTCTYDAATKVGTMYINGEKMKAQDFNLWPDDDAKRNVTGLKYAGVSGNNHLALGFIQDKNDPSITDGWADYNDPNNNHFKGQLDDLRFYHKALTETEIGLMYNSEKP
ncbi:MAG: LamG-like jellyroll fold domain-containing protein [Bacteroidales bacterium]|nr:LamG-like jellyroll fold domain-containing protein [Bacteroidales bacterium]